MPRRLWADAICINQDNLIEKGQQIPLMARIFRSATQVIVWLGKGEEDESRAVDELAAFARKAGPRGFPLGGWKRQNHKPETCQALVDTEKSAKKVFEMPWFSRRWIVQELVLNGDVMFYCGKSRISWPALHFAFEALPTGTWDEHPDAHIRRKLRQLGALWRIWSFGDNSTMNCGIYSLLNSFTDLQCKEAKDIVYAIAGLADDIELRSSTSPAGVASITPNYEISDDEVFRDLAFKMIQSGNVFSTLACAGASRIATGEEPLASWIPDVRHPGSWPLIATERKADFKLLDVCKPVNGILTLNIEVYGWEQDMSMFNMSSNEGSSMINVGSYIVEWKTSNFHLDHRDQWGDKMPDWRPLSIEDVFEAPKNWTDHDGHNLFKHILSWSINHYKAGDLDDWDPGLDTLAHMLWSLIRCQVLTEDGYESFGHLPSLENFQKQLRDETLDGQCESYLTKALSTSKIYSIGHRGMGTWTRFVGFGPHDLNPCDVILLPSNDTKSATTLFLRPTGTEYTVLGAGLSWAWRHDLPTERLMPREIEVRLI